MSDEFRTIGLIGRFSDTAINESMGTLALHLLDAGHRVVVEPGTNLDARAATVPLEEMPVELDLLIAIGGDGTMLYATRVVADHGVPVLGINRGRLGFLADIGPDVMLSGVDEVLAGRFDRESRLLLQAELEQPDGTVVKSLALNDVVLQKWDVGRMLEFETWVDGTYVNTHGGDGLIVATATGSTAYALSCGGPIISPHLDAIALVPVCPHTLSDRPIVIRADREIEIRLVERQDTKAQLTCDGQLLGDVLPGQIVRVNVAPHRASLLHPQGYDYYRTLRSKLNWGRGSRSKLTAKPGTSSDNSSGKPE